MLLLPFLHQPLKSAMFFKMSMVLDAQTPSPRLPALVMRRRIRHQFTLLAVVGTSLSSLHPLKRSATVHSDIHGPGCPSSISAPPWWFIRRRIRPSHTVRRCERRLADRGNDKVQYLGGMKSRIPSAEHGQAFRTLTGRGGGGGGAIPLPRANTGHQHDGLPFIQLFGIRETPQSQGQTTIERRQEAVVS